MAAMRSFLWYRLAGIDHYLIHGGMIVFGVILGLLGLLAARRYHRNDLIAAMIRTNPAQGNNHNVPLSAFEMGLASKTARSPAACFSIAARVALSVAYVVFRLFSDDKASFASSSSLSP
jgi:hypothetical protein